MGWPRPSPGTDGLREVLGALRCLQLDPVGVVASSHELVLWSRVGAFERADLDRPRWEERWLFDYWAHAASIVLTEDHALHHLMMRRYPRGASDHGKRLVAWIEANALLREHILQRLTGQGPMPTDQFEDLSVAPWESTGWTAGRNVERMLDVLWTQGRVMVAGRTGRRRHWDLAERCLPKVVEHPAAAGVVVQRQGQGQQCGRAGVVGAFPGAAQGLGRGALTVGQEAGQVRAAPTRPRTGPRPQVSGLGWFSWW